jgi:ribonuclease Z
MFEANALCDNIPINEWFNFIDIKDDNENLNINSNKNNLQIQIIKCDHKIPTVSYGFGLKKNKLNPIFSNLSGKEISQLRKQGTDISIETIDKIFCYVCDTSINVFIDNPFILQYKTIFIECTFIMDGEEDIAINKQHIHWKQLKPYILNHPQITFMLFHFSLKYKDEEIKEFMDIEFQNNNINNVELWLSDLSN